MSQELLDMKFLLDNMFDGNKARMLRIVSHGLKKARDINDLVLVVKIERDLKLIKEL